MPDSQSLGLLLRRYRRQAALSQDALASRSGVSARSISDLERGQRTSAHFETLRMLADALGLIEDDRARLFRAAHPRWIDVTLQRLPLDEPERHRLPAPVAKLIGREREVAQLAQELSAGTNRLLTLTGPGGVGKTRLALEVATRVAPHFSGRAAWIDLAPVLDADVVVPTIASSLGLDTPGLEAIDGLRKVCDDQPFLLILDNFEQVIEAAPMVSVLLAVAPALKVLVTSRAALRVVSELEYPVGPLGVPERGSSLRDIQHVESVQFFVDRAVAVQRDMLVGPETLEVAAQICQHLDGLPLAIELATSRLNALTPRQLLDRLEQRLPLLGRARRDTPPRQQTMRNAIAWSYNLLDSDAQRLFRKLSVFVGGFNLDTVEWLLGRQASDGVVAVDALATLLENSMIFRVPNTADSARFTMYETIREFGIEQLSEQQELHPTYELLAAYCQGLTQFGDGIPNCIVPAAWLSTMDREWGNIRAAHHYLAHSNDPGRLLEFTVAFGHYLYNRGLFQEGWSWFEQILDASPDQPPSLRLQALYWASHLSSHLGASGRALELGNEAMHLANEHGDLSWRATIVHCLGLIHLTAGDSIEAEALLAEALRLWEAAGVQGLSGFDYMLLGSIAFDQGDLLRTRTLEAQAAAIFYKMSGLGWVAMTKWYGGLCSVAEGDLRDAAFQFDECLRLSIEHMTSLIHYKGLIGLACVASELALYERAGQLIGAAESCLESTGQQLGRLEQTMYDGVISTCRSAMGTVACDEARRLGGAGDRSSWIESGEAIKRTATRLAAQRANRETVEEMAISGVLRSDPAAD
jgi:predicted ATPase/DNA-binding XRE family transcriptional regulator